MRETKEVALSFIEEANRANVREKKTNKNIKIKIYLPYSKIRTIYKFTIESQLWKFIVVNYSDFQNIFFTIQKYRIWFFLFIGTIYMEKGK